MSLTMSQGDGVTVITVTTNPKSKCPILCQLLGTLCYSPVCSVAPGLKGKLTNTLTAFAVVQMIVGVLNLVLGIILARFQVVTFILEMNTPFWLGGVFLAVGIICMLTAQFPNPCLLIKAVVLNIASAALAITAIVLYSIDLALGSNQWCYDHIYPRYDDATPSPEQKINTELCQYFMHLNQMILGGLDIMMIVLSVFQLCVTINFCVLTLKALCKKSEDGEYVEDAQLHKPLLEEAAGNPAC